MRHPKNKRRGVCVADIIDWMESIAPADLAEDWDNVGLQIGSVKQAVHKIRVALDPLGTVIDAAVAEGVDLLITHHPLILRPLTHVDLESPAGRSIAAAIKGRLTIFSAHTNLDSAATGINAMLAQRIGITNPECLLPCPGGGSSLGLGRIGRLETPQRVEDLARRIKDRLQLPFVKVAGNMDVIASKAAVCSGSGSSLLDAFLASDAQVYISGDMRYHNARDVEAAGRALIDIGHFSSEHIVVEDLVARLQKTAATAGWAVQVEACSREHEPFVSV